MPRLGDILLALVLVTIADSVQSAGDPAAGKAKSALCAVYHGVDSNSEAPTAPKLAGQWAEYIPMEMEEFRFGRRKPYLIKALKRIRAGMRSTDRYWLMQQSSCTTERSVDRRNCGVSDRSLTANAQARGRDRALTAHPPCRRARRAHPRLAES